MKLTVKAADGTVKEFESEAWKTLLDQLNEKGYDIPWACGIGTCGACMCWVEEGAENIDGAGAHEPMFPLDDSEVLTCCATIKEGEWEVKLSVE